MNLLLFNLLLCTDCCTLVVVHVLDGTWYRPYCAERFYCSVKDLIYGRLPINISSYVRKQMNTFHDCFQTVISERTHFRIHNRVKQMRCWK